MSDDNVSEQNMEKMESTPPLKENGSLGTGTSGGTAKKMSLPLIILVLLVVTGVAGVLFRGRPAIIHQDKAYGISGKITAITENSVTVTTSSLPVAGIAFSPLEKWIWQVGTEKTFVIRRVSIPAQDQSKPQQEEFKDMPKTKNDLKVGMLVTITSAEDFSSQFKLAEKKIQALEIRIYE